ncbi:hypothetical protein TNCV_1089481 [Trichonephila clavipes]|uniref:Uncharacterized protein n=1 Tax=Trichonephila clavipes TaxID=2585209 RepID=A0A8X6SXA0_TRICX|nr:hypothetical protein TNCV_1089481 [Trichonephila clavipes]
MPVPLVEGNARISEAAKRILDMPGIFQNVAFSNDSRFNWGSDDNRVLLWMPRDERHNFTLAVQRHNSHKWCADIGQG